jgi:single-strand DNA-binding protein
MSYNKITLIGNVGKDPELKTINADMKVAEFNLAINEKVRDASGNMVDKTEWYRISCWNRQADVVMNYVRKGNQIFIEGKLTVRSFVDSNGKDRYSLEVRASDVQLLGGRPTGDESPENRTQTPYRNDPPPARPQPIGGDYKQNNDDDLPF